MWLRCSFGIHLSDFRGRGAGVWLLSWLELFLTCQSRKNTQVVPGAGSLLRRLFSRSPRCHARVRALQPSSTTTLKCGLDAEEEATKIVTLFGNFSVISSGGCFYIKKPSSSTLYKVRTGLPLVRQDPKSCSVYLY